MSELFSSSRIDLLDSLRGVAVMGILLMNITAFALPDAAYLQPTAAGGNSLADHAVWALSVLLVDGKMRGLFSILFGASMWLVWTRADEAGGNGRAVHQRRMGWLLLFGLVHYFLIWPGDILILYAICGLMAGFFVTMEEQALPRHILALLIITAVVYALLGGTMLWMQADAAAAGATQSSLDSYRAMVGALAGDSVGMAEEVARARGPWLDAVSYRLVEDATGPLVLLMIFGAETLALMVLGMAALRAGFLTGAWEAARYRTIMRWSYLFGLPPLVAMLVWDWMTSFDPMTNFLLFGVLATPFRLAVTVGHATLAILLLKRFAGSVLVARITAAGRVAFTNYLGTSILMTALFNGWGLGQFGHWSRWQIYCVVPLVWGMMLLWSQPWLVRYRYGPLEWLWRSLARGRLERQRR